MRHTTGSRERFVGMDVVEVSPPYDHAGITALAAASVAQELLAAYGSRAARPESESSAT